jgi:magnesium-transporting ATPase (P-type)
MAAFHQTPDRGKQVYLKGAPEMVLDFCSSIRNDGEVVGRALAMAFIPIAMFQVFNSPQRSLS